MYLHAVGELIDNALTALPLLGSGKHHVVSMQYHHHLVDMLLGLSGVDKEQVPPNHSIQIEGYITAAQLSQSNGVVDLLHQTVHHPQGILYKESWSLTRVLHMYMHTGHKYSKGSKLQN